VPNLAIVGKDSQALSPSRASLAQLLHRRAQLVAQAEPLNQRLMRIVEVVAKHQRAAARRDALLAAHEAGIGEAILAGQPRPEPPAELVEAEAAVEAARRDQRAVNDARERVEAEAAGINGQLAALTREITDQVCAVMAESAADYARNQYRAAFREMRSVEAAVDGVYAELRAIGMREQQTGGGQGAMRALESLEKQLRALRTELAADKAPNLEPARRLMSALATDPAAKLEAS
jgi:hypothetical protein